DEGAARGARHQRAGLRPVPAHECVEVAVDGRRDLVLRALPAAREGKSSGGEGGGHAPHSAASISRCSSAASGGSGVFARSGRSRMASTIEFTWSGRTPSSDSVV